MGRYKTYSIPYYLDLETAIQAFTVENDVVKKAVVVVRDRHAHRWQTKEGTYRVKKQLDLPDVRDAPSEREYGRSLSTGRAACL